MSPDDPHQPRALATWPWKPLRWLLNVAGFLVLTWSTLAIYYSNLPWAWARLGGAILLAAFGAWALWITRRPRMTWVLAGLYLGILAWWSFIQPSNDRAWRPDVAVMPRAFINGDQVRITGVRNFDYRTRDDFTVRYEERQVSLAHLTAVDFFISYWSTWPIGHTFVSFVFDNAPPVSVSIETRPEAGEGYSPIASMFKQYELIYVVGDERDIVGVRTNHRNEEVFLFNLRVPAKNVRQLFLVYLDRINQLADRPEFYHLLSNSCTVNIVRYANAAGRVGEFDFRHLINGWIDQYFYDAGLLNPTLQFQELRRRSRVNEAALAAGAAPDFPERIRAALPAMRR